MSLASRWRLTVRLRSIGGETDLQSRGMSLSYRLFRWSSSFGFHAYILPVKNLLVNPLDADLFTGKIIAARWE